MFISLGGRVILYIPLSLCSLPMVALYLVLSFFSHNERTRRCGEGFVRCRLCNVESSFRSFQKKCPSSCFNTTKNN